jgi:SSS family solute:Na+ symporter
MFGLLDAVFFFAYMGIVLFIGFAVARKEKATINDYFRAGNTLPWYAIGASIIAAGISSEQFVGEVGYAYKLGMPVANWEWLVFPALSIFLWIFVPIYVRGRITTMPEYLERRYGPTARTLYAIVIVASYIFANFALVFYTGGYAMEKMWGFNRIGAVWMLAVLTGAYTIYGGMVSVAWTDFFQCILLMGGGIFVFFAGMHRLNWDFSAVLGEGQRARLIAPQSHEIPWTALIILALSTNVWYYATDQFINQRCLGAKNEWHAKMGVLLAGGLQLLLPLATCFPGMIYYAINPNLEDHNAAYPAVVAALVAKGLRGLVVAAVLGAIMSTISGLVNSTATIVTLDIFRRWKGRNWPEARLVRFGQWAGGAALLVGALFAPVVMKWDSIFRYCQDIWAPMAAPAVVVFMGGALWKPARERGAVAGLWLSILTIPLTFLKSFLADSGVHILPGNLDNSLVFAGGIFLVSVVLLAALSLARSVGMGLSWSVVLGFVIFFLVEYQPAIAAVLIMAVFAIAMAYYCYTARTVAPNMWDRSMVLLPKGEPEKWYFSIWFWWLVLAGVFVAIYIKFS